MTDPLAHLPDPDKRYQVMGITRGEFAFIEILDNETKQGFVIDLVTALEVSSDITAEAVRVMDEMGQRAGTSIDPETVDRNDPRWHQEVWRRDSLN